MKTFSKESRLERLVLDKPFDLRFKVHYPNEWPYSNIGIVKTPYIFGTGVLLSPNIILTSAHIIYHTTIPSKIEFICPQMTITKPPQRIAIKNYFIPKSFNIDDPQPNKNDWALLYFNSEQQISNEKFKPINISVLENNKVKYPITLIGYPGDKKGEMYETSGEIFENFPDFFSYKLDTTTGQSGSPILMRKEGVLFLIGIHHSSDLLIEKLDNIKVREYTNKNWGIRITEELKNQIKKFESQESKINSVKPYKIIQEENANIFGKNRDGYCIIYFKNGEKYIGQTDNENNFHGHGIYYFLNGGKYDGIFKKGQFHGFGVYHKKDGRMEERVYENGNRLV